MRCDILGLAEVARAGIQTRIQVGDLCKDLMSSVGMRMAAMTVRAGASRIAAGEGIHPCPRTEVRTCVEAGSIGVRASGTEMAAADAVTSQTADVVRQCSEGMLHLRLADLLKTLVVRRTAAHSIKVLRYDRMVKVRQGKPVEVDLSVIARLGTDRDTDLRSG